MNILLTGSSGQLGQELLPQLRELGKVTGVDRSVAAGDKRTVSQDLADLNRVEVLLNRTRPDVVVNAAAYTAVDRAESESVAAFRLNAELPGCLARWAERNGRFLLHYSTDYVFGGDAERPYRETDPTGPLNVYGESKLAGEWAISSSGCRHLVLRTSWVYSAHGNNFVLTMLRLARERPELNIVSDQTGCPTWARNLAAVSRRLLERAREEREAHDVAGLYHYCDGDALNWYDFARAIFDTAHQLGLLERLPVTRPVPSSKFPQIAERPLNSVLDTTAVRETFDIQPAGLQTSLRTCLEQLVSND